MDIKQKDILLKSSNGVMPKFESFGGTDIEELSEEVDKPTILKNFGGTDIEELSEEVDKPTILKNFGGTDANELTNEDKPENDEIQEDGATVQDGEPENKPANSTQSQQSATIKMKKGKPLQKKVQAVASNLQKKVESHNDKIKAFKAISKKLKKMQKMNDLEKALLKSYKKKDKEADPQDLSEGFRMPPKKQGLGLETVASRDGDSIKFEITGTKDRDDLAAFIGLTVSISGLKNNEALIDFVSAVRVGGFEEAVKYMNSDEMKKQYKCGRIQTTTFNCKSTIEKK